MSKTTIFTSSDQEWFWSKKWQAMEHEADEAEANGEYADFENVNKAVEYLSNLGSYKMDFKKLPEPNIVNTDRL